MVSSLSWRGDAEVSEADPTEHDSVGFIQLVCPLVCAKYARHGLAGTPTTHRSTPVRSHQGQNWGFSNHY